MNWQEIERLLEKFYEGDTSLAEEQEIARFFAEEEVPPHLTGVKPQFDFLRAEKTGTLQDDRFDERVMGLIRAKGVKRIIDLRNPWLYWMSGVAATVLILVAIFLEFNPFSRTITDTYTNPEMAYTEARKIMLFVSAKLNQGTSKLEPVGKFSDGIKALEIMDTYDEGINKISSLDKFNDIIQIN